MITSSHLKRNEIVSHPKSKVVRLAHDGVNFWELSLFQSLGEKSYYQAGPVNGLSKSILDFELKSGIDDKYPHLWFHVCRDTKQPFACFAKPRYHDTDSDSVIVASTVLLPEGDKVNIASFLKTKLNASRESKNVHVSFYNRRYNIWSGTWVSGIVNDEIRVANHDGKKRTLYSCTLGKINHDKIHGIGLFVKQRKPNVVVYHEQKMSFFKPDSFNMETDSLLTMKWKEPDVFNVNVVPKGKFKFIKFNPIVGFGCIACELQIAFFPTIEPERITLIECNDPVTVAFSPDGQGAWAESYNVYTAKINLFTHMNIKL